MRIEDYIHVKITNKQGNIRNYENVISIKKLDANSIQIEQRIDSTLYEKSFKSLLNVKNIEIDWYIGEIEYANP